MWEEVSTNLRRRRPARSRRGPGRIGAARHRAAASAEPADAAERAPRRWQLPGDLGRRYASVSGDINPIHMHALTARLFGFPSAIAHGMWTKARCLAALGPRLPDASRSRSRFKRPILLPATVTFAERAGDDGGAMFEVRDSVHETLHLSGRIPA